MQRIMRTPLFCAPTSFFLTGNAGHGLVSLRTRKDRPSLLVQFPTRERANTMRLPCTFLAGVVLAAPVLILSSGCDSGSSDLEKPTEIKKVTPENDMPGFKKMIDEKKGGAKTP